jgi:hypothetical protein
MATYLIRAIRWQGLLLPLGRAGLANCFNATVIGFMVNFLAPGRLGEIARPYLLARREGFSASGAFATILLERVLDLVTVVFFVAFWLLAAPNRSRSEEIVSSLELGGVLGLGFAVVALASMFLIARYPAPRPSRGGFFAAPSPSESGLRLFETLRGPGVMACGPGEGVPDVGPPVARICFRSGFGTL